MRFVPCRCAVCLPGTEKTYNTAQGIISTEPLHSPAPGGTKICSILLQSVPLLLRAPSPPADGVAPRGGLGKRPQISGQFAVSPGIFRTTRAGSPPSPLHGIGVEGVVVGPSPKARNILWHVTREANPAAKCAFKANIEHICLMFASVRLEPTQQKVANSVSPGMPPATPDDSPRERLSQVFILQSFQCLARPMLIDLRRIH